MRMKDAANRSRKRSNLASGVTWTEYIQILNGRHFPHLASFPAQPQAKIANPKTKRPATLVWSNKDYTNPKYVGTIWWIADHLKNLPIPLSH